MVNKNLLNIAGIAVLIGTSGCSSYMNKRELVFQGDEFENISCPKGRYNMGHNHTIGYVHRLKKDKE